MPEYRYPQTNVFYRKLTRSFPRIVRGEGCWLYDDEGKPYLDAVGGAFVVNIGHGVAEVAEAMASQARRVAFAHAAAFTAEPVEELAQELAALAPEGLGHVYFLCSGSEAVEAALKLARQFWAESGRPEKSKIIARSPGYHGNTLLALSASAREHYRRQFSGWLVDVPRIPAPYAYRCPCRGSAPDCPACSGSALEEALLREGPESVAAFIAEPVGGSSTGAAVPRPEYYRRIREICDRHEVLFIADEVLTGAGRTGTWSAIDPYGALPDIQVLGKGIAGGYAPLSALLASRRVLDPIAAGSGALNHAQTFSHHAVGCAAGLAVVRLLKARRLVERAAELGKVLQGKLSALAELPHVGDVRGRGMLAGVEFVADKESRESFPRSARFAESFTEAASACGLVVWPNVGQADGERGDLAMIAPPFIISEAEMDEIVTRFKTALELTLKKMRSS